MIQLPDGGQGMTQAEREAMFAGARQAQAQVQQQFNQLNASAVQMAGGAQGLKAGPIAR